MILPPPTEGSREVAERVARAPAMQAERYAAIGLPQVRANAAAHGPVLEDVARPDAAGLALLRDAADAMRLSARGYHRVLRVARTLADLDGAEKVGRVHLAEALSYRALADEGAAGGVRWPDEGSRGRQAIFRTTVGRESCFSQKFICPSSLIISAKSSPSLFPLLTHRLIYPGSEFPA